MKKSSACKVMQTTKQDQGDSVDTLFYDGQCPICRAEINRLETQLDADLHCVDIHQAEVPGIDRQQLFTELHLRRADGSWLVGLEANVAAWQHTRWRPLANVLLWPGIRWIAEAGYRVWLVWYQKQRAKRDSQPNRQAR